MLRGTFKTVTTLTILAMLASARSIAATQPMTRRELDEINPFALPTCPPDYLDTTQIKLDRDFINKFIVTYDDTITQAQCSALVDTILLVHDHHPSFANTIELAFQSEDFHILLHPNTKAVNHVLKLGTQIDGSNYYVHNQLIRVPADFATSLSHNILVDMRAKLRHAALNRVQRVLSQTKTPSVKPYFPDNEEEHMRILTGLQYGDKKVAKVRDQLASGENTAELDALRRVCHKTFHEFYLGNTDITDPISFMRGPTTLTTHDPLEAAIFQIESGVTYAQRIGASYVQIRDSMLFSRVQPQMLEYFYGEHFAYTNELINRALGMSQFEMYRDVASLRDYYHADLTGLETAKAIKSYTTVDIINPWDQENALFYARAAIEKKLLLDARQILNKLVQQSERLREKASLELVRIDVVEKEERKQDAMRELQNNLRASQQPSSSPSPERVSKIMGIPVGQKKPYEAKVKPKPKVVKQAQTQGYKTRRGLGRSG